MRYPAHVWIAETSADHVTALVNEREVFAEGESEAGMLGAVLWAAMRYERNTRKRIISWPCHVQETGGEIEALEWGWEIIPSKRRSEYNIWAVGRDHPETSHMAMAAVLKKISERERWVMEFVHARGIRGATSDEVEQSVPAAWGIHQSVSSLTSQMRTKNLLFTVPGYRRPTKSSRGADVLLTRFWWEEAWDRYGPALNSDGQGSKMIYFTR